MPGLGVREITVTFGGLKALQQISFDVSPGSVVGVIGPNGAGKTTLFNVISGLVRPTAGELHWDDKPFRPKPDRLVHHGIARTLQAVGLFGRLTALQNVMAGGAGSRRAGFMGALFATPGSGRDEHQLRLDALRWLDQLGVAGLADRPADSLPYPVKKKVALARALISRPRLLLLDEPAGGLGIEDLEPLAELIRVLPDNPDSPCAVLLVEHRMDLVMAVCDRVVVLDFGKLVTAGTPAEVQADPAVATAYLGVDVPAADQRQAPTGPAIG